MKGGGLAACLGLGVLAGCAPVPGPVLRDGAAPFSSQVDVTPARLAGDWVVRLVSEGGAVAPGQVVRFSALQPEGPGRFRLGQGAGAALRGRVIWVIWMDGDSRTVALATAEGDLALIMDRTGAGGADRIRAARDILEWQGFDMALMRGFAG